MFTMRKITRTRRINNYERCQGYYCYYLTKASYSSLNGADKEADNIVSIKKIQMNDGKEYPYCSSQAVRRALREQLASMGWELSETTVAKQRRELRPLCANLQNILMTTFWFYECRFQQDCKKDKPCEGITPCSAGAVWRRHGFWNQLYVGESRRDTEHI